MKSIKDIIYDEKNNLTLDVNLPEEDEFDVFIYFHGGGLERGTKANGDRFAPDLAQRGIATVSANYRKYPDAHYPDFIVDSANVVAWVVKNIGSYGNAKRIFVGGSSAGGYLSMMLCFDRRYLEAVGVSPDAISGYIHDAGQPTSHFNVLREKGIDSRRIIVDETAPLYFIGLEKEYPPMIFIVSDNDMENRFEQTTLVLSTLKHFGYDMSKVDYKLMNSTHCAYGNKYDDNGKNELGKLIIEFIEKR